MGDKSKPQYPLARVLLIIARCIARLRG